MSPLYARKTLHLGLLSWQFTEHGFSSWSVHLGVVTWNSRRGWSLNLPGPLFWRQRRTTRRH